MTRETTIEAEHPFPMSESDLRKLGLAEVGYIKKYNLKGQPAWVLHAADGTALAVQDNPGAARLSAQHKELNLVTVH